MIVGMNETIGTLESTLGSAWVVNEDGLVMRHARS